MSDVQERVESLSAAAAEFVISTPVKLTGTAVLYSRHVCRAS